MYSNLKEAGWTAWGFQWQSLKQKQAPRLKISGFYRGYHMYAGQLWQIRSKREAERREKKEGEERRKQGGESVQAAICSFIYQTLIACQLWARHWNVRDFFCLGFIGFLVSCSWFSSNVKFSIIISSKVFYIPSSPLLSSGDPTYTYIRPLEVVQSLLMPIHFF